MSGVLPPGHTTPVPNYGYTAGTLAAAQRFTEDSVKAEITRGVMPSVLGARGSLLTDFLAGVGKAIAFGQVGANEAFKVLVDQTRPLRERLDEAEKKMKDAIAGFEDGVVTEADLLKAIDAVRAQFNASIAENAADIAAMGTQLASATADAVQKSLAAVADAIERGTQSGVVIINAIRDATTDVIKTFFGDGGTKWSDEIFVAASPVVTGPNDTPLGVAKGYGGRITDVILRASDYAADAAQKLPGVDVAITINGVTAFTASLTSQKTVVSGLNAEFKRFDILGVEVTRVAASAPNLSVALRGKYT